MDENQSAAVQDYLKVIYHLTVDDQRATTNQIAEALGVAPASVTGMLQKLAESDPPLVEYRKHQGVLLTEHGRRSALEMIRHHRLLETFLQQVLGYSWDEVHGEAERLEHVISEEMEERIARKLGDPGFDPHGEPIPDRSLVVHTERLLRLSELQPGQAAVVVSVEGDDEDLLRYLSKVGLSLNQKVYATKVSPYDGILTLWLVENASELTLGERITQKVFVRVEQAQPEPSVG